jgi:hypothetical protein
MVLWRIEVRSCTYRYVMYVVEKTAANCTTTDEYTNETSCVIYTDVNKSRVNWKSSIR